MKSKLLSMLLVVCCALNVTIAQNNELSGRWNLETYGENGMPDKYSAQFLQYGDSLIFGLAKNDTVTHTSLLRFIAIEDNLYEIKQSIKRAYVTIEDSINTKLSYVNKVQLVTDSLIYLFADTVRYTYRLYSNEDNDCLSTNPRADFEWMGQYTTRQSIIVSYFYKMEQYFSVNSNPNMVDNSSQVYNCDGELICSIGGISPDIISGEAEVCFNQDFVYFQEYPWLGIEVNLPPGFEPTNDTINYPNQSTGIEQEINNIFDVYPNPVKEILQLTHNFNGRVKIRNLQGKLIHSTNMTGRNLHVGFLKAGIYIVEFLKNDESIVSRKIMKL